MAVNYRLPETISDFERRKKTSRDHLRSLLPLEKIEKLALLQEQYLSIPDDTGTKRRQAHSRKIGKNGIVRVENMRKAFQIRGGG